ncbi:MAG TPA: ABC transporter permease [Actinomycetota bacterium]
MSSILTTVAEEAAPAPAETRAARLRWALVDGLAVARRDLDHVRRQPGLLLASLIFPAIMVVLFGYIFGSAISVPGGGNYRAYLMPGLFAMTTVTGVIVTATAVTDDLARGVMDRFRSMPIARWAVPFGQTAADLLACVLGLVGMVICGLAVGWRANHGLASAAGAFGLLLLLRYAVSWGGIAIGLAIRRPETVDAMTPLVFPLTMLGNAFVPTAGMPAWLRLVAEWNPVSAAVAACRELFGNPGAATGGAWPLQHPVVATIAWSLLLLAVLVPLSTRLYTVSGR